MLDLDDLAKLEKLHSDAIPESTHLEYKASPAIQSTEKAREEISKDISAMANADGGQIIYGMTESRDHLPAGLDGGINPKPYDGLWLEQVIQQNIRPKIEGLKILVVPKGDGNNHYFVVEVPRSTTVHQAKDGRYYRRRNFRNDIMEDYEIREAMNRNTVPDLYVTIELLTQDPWLSYQTDGSYSDPVTLLFEIGNRSNSLALYSVVQLRLDPKLKVISAGGFEGSDNVYIKKFAVPQQFPIFRELPLSISKNFNVALPKIPHGYQAVYPIVIVTITPGSSTINRWQLVQLNDQISLEQTK